MLQGWNKETRRDGSLVYRHGESGCTLQMIRRGSGSDLSSRCVSWLLFTRTYELLEIFQSNNANGDIPTERAERLIQKVSVAEMTEPRRPGIDLLGAYTIVELED